MDHLNYEAVKAPFDISSAIDTDNILPRRTRNSAHSVEKIVKAMLVTSPDPTTYAQALARPDANEWKSAMDRELNALHRMDVWEEVELQIGEHALGTTWVYKRKTNEIGKLVKYKARLCAKGFAQVEGKDYLETYAPTGRLAAL